MSFNDAELAQASAERAACNIVYPEPPPRRDLTADLTEALTALEVPLPKGIHTYRDLAGEIITEMIEQRDAKAGKAWTQETLR